MKLAELYVIGDDGGMHRHMDDAIKNMEHHAKNHKSEEMRQACKSAIASIQSHMQRPLSIYDDPHTFLKILQHFKGEPDLNKIKHGAHALGSYTQTDND